MLAAALLAALAHRAPAQDADPGRDFTRPSFEPGTSARGGKKRPFGQNPGEADLPGLRLPGSEGGAQTGTDEPGPGEGISRLPRFRTGPATISGLSGAPGAKPPRSLLRQRATPPRRFLQPTRAVTQARTQEFITDLRLTPVIRDAVSGLPAPTNVTLPTAIPLLGLTNPGALLLGNNLAFLRRPEEADPAYAPLGFRLGAFTVLPAFTQSVGFDSNPNLLPPREAKGSLALRSEGDVAFRSDWSAHEATGELRGAYDSFPGSDAENRPNASGVTRMRFDLNRDSRLELEGRFLIDTLRAGGPEVGATSAVRPLFASYGASLGIVENFGRILVSLRGEIDRQVFEDARLGDGSLLIQSDRNSTQYGLRLRTGYEISPVITPFVETLVDRRAYDTRVGVEGLRRDSDGISVSAGASLTLTRFLTAEIAAGLQHRDYEDRALRPITAPIVNAALIWAVSPLTTVRFGQQTGVIETALAGSSGVFTDVTTLEVQHELLRNLSITVGGAYFDSDYEGIRLRERSLSVLARLDYRFNRWLTLRGAYVYQTLSSSLQGASFDDHIALLGMRINP